MTGFTPPPWRWVEAKSGLLLVLCGKDGETVCDFGIAAQHSRCAGVPPEGADYHLIAAAPDLYAELDHARELLALKGIIVDAIDAALAKARGEQVAA
jgi:hypothetical protein